MQARRLRKTAAREVQDATQALEHTRTSATGVADRRTRLEVCCAILRFPEYMSGTQSCRGKLMTDSLTGSKAGS